ncbi:DNA-binding response regulator [Phormidesmis priestleyi ULC007]|uniref:DNA-binding response regulator n=1 Tax=Phormidesmis priestleyi ULC007 TaxID=1920490 RepID=A0A2T1D7Z5_9CYAN|nr:response regulator transcription factor [Phormidesmis priestleyi]PSB16619.1 DNA-binding response regulator [Phormidesmis priestleyi ULC007]PZO47523.1 MAG: DNA-binding response regulator [Phormidesmis priestleyi]
MSQEISKSTEKILVIDDHESVLNGTVEGLKRQYPTAEIQTAQTAQAASQWVEQGQPDLLVMDLSIPNVSGEIAQTETGIQVLKTLMQIYPTLNIVVQSAHVRSLVRLKPIISNHEGGFTIADKSLPLQEMLKLVDWALKGVNYTPKEMRTRLELKHEWMNVLKLAFHEGLQDRAIAERLNVAERTVRHYWTKIQDALEVYPEEGKNIRIQTELRSRQEGLID